MRTALQICLPAIILVLIVGAIYLVVGDQPPPPPSITDERGLLVRVCPDRTHIFRFSDGSYWDRVRRFSWAAEVPASEIDKVCAPVIR